MSIFLKAEDGTVAENSLVEDLDVGSAEATSDHETIGMPRTCKK